MLPIVSVNWSTDGGFVICVAVFGLLVHDSFKAVTVLTNEDTKMYKYYRVGAIMHLLKLSGKLCGGST